MASTEATVKLPSIESLKVTIKEGRADEEDQDKSGDPRKLSKASSFVSRLQLGSLQKHRRPGDMWGGASARQPRPLGLIPDRRSKFDIIRELSRFLPPLTSYTSRPINVPLASDEGVKDEPSSVAVNSQVEVISATVRTPAKEQGQRSVTPTHFTQPRIAEAPPPSSLLGEEPVPYRYPCGSHGNEGDQDYLDTLAKCDLGSYYPPPPVVSQARPSHQPRHVTAETWSGPVQVLSQQVGRNKMSGKLGRRHFVSSGPQFLTFSEQSQLFDRALTDDRRQPLPWEPCERCRERGERCGHCKALRVGGGYIILDGEALSDDELRKRLGKRYTLTGGQSWTVGGSGGRRGVRGREGDGEGLGGGSGGVDSEAGEAGDGRGGRGSGPVGSDGRYSGLGESGNDGRLSSRSGREQFDAGGGGWNDRGRGDGRGRGLQHDKDSSGRSDGGGGYSGVGGTDRDGGMHRRGGGSSGAGEAGDGDGYDLGVDRPGTSRGGSLGSRPGSTLGSRPPSSLKRGRGLERRDRDKKSMDIEGSHGRGRGRRRGGGEGESGSEDSDDEGKGKRRRKKEVTNGDNNDGTEKGVDDFERSKFKFKSTKDEDDPRPMSGYHGNLMRFKRKKDDVKAIHATLQELQGIDPLDYLARYCIIDQTKLPHYQRCYDNVDRDEDDEIDIGELDFALKAVNYDLISDSEMSYVHSVLELAGRYKLNFRLFSLIAALSEKVVALEDMVKRLINKMDFEALEVKMKKCKELFYLLADSESNREHEGGVVTTGSLAVELQAGGLTSEHVDFVVDRLNHEGKGLVEFLDYLTYVPLFVEIHDSISGNPLDFSRTK